MDIFIPIALALVVLGISFCIFLLVWLLHQVWSVDVPAEKLTTFEGSIITMVIIGFVCMLTYFTLLVGAIIWSDYVL